MVEPAGFNAVKAALIDALQRGDFQHEARSKIEVKNLLAMGQISAADVVAVLKRSRGSAHQTSAHHLDASITVHVVTTSGWYIKFYFLDPQTWFICVHE